MANMGRKLGVNIYSLMQNKNISRQLLAEKTGYSFRDVCRLIEGKLLLPPAELSKIAMALGTTKVDLIQNETSHYVPELQYMKEFDNPEHLEKVLDLLDEYVELKEIV